MKSYFVTSTTMLAGRCMLLIWLSLLYARRPPRSDAFQPTVVTALKSRTRLLPNKDAPHCRGGTNHDDGGPPIVFDEDQEMSAIGNIVVVSRRDAIRNSVSSTAAIVVTAAASTMVPTEASSSSALRSATDLGRPIDLDCLSDLPPIGYGHIRIYLCRHGQTENNRLRKVQGARLDPPINDNGRTQAENLGAALSRALPGSSLSSGGGSGSKRGVLFFSSPLERARVTADIAARIVAAAGPPMVVGRLDSLSEVDFGPVVEGRPVRLATAKMALAYSAWAAGRIDYRPEGGGDSGREVLTRAATAMQELVGAAEAANAQSVVAVSHSASLRVLVGLLLGESLVASAARKIWNGSVTVVDVPKTPLITPPPRTVGSSTKPLGVHGGRSSPRKSREFALQHVPESFNVIRRISEYRHLPPSTLQQ